MTTATLSIGRVQKNIQTRIDSIDMPAMNWKAVCLSGFCVAMLLLVFYVWQVNNLTRGSYIINGYEKQINALSEQNQNLEVSFAESSFMGQALTKIQQLSFQKATSVKYIQVSNDSVAVNIK